ncbi:unnamed protein product [Choristocarpus tenellus]
MDELDLDAILDDTQVPDVNTGDGEPDDLDLDSMLDDALNTTIDIPANTDAVKGKVSSAFGPSEQWLSRQKGGGGKSGNGIGRTGEKKELWPFLSEERREAWGQALVEDAQRQVGMDKQRPLSRAYSSFTTGKDEGGAILHLGSGAADKLAQAQNGGSTDQASGLGTMAVIGGGCREVENMFEDILDKCIATAGVEEISLCEDENDKETVARLRASYLNMVAKDVKSRVANDPDMDPSRFPGIASKVLC